MNDQNLIIVIQGMLAQLTFYVSHIYIYNWPYQIDALFMKYFLQIFCYVGFQHFQMPNPNRYMHLQMLPKSHKYHLHLKCHLEHTIFLFRTKSKKVINLKILPLLMNEFGFYIKGFRCFNCQGWSSYHDDLSDGFVYWRPLQELKPRSDQPSKLIPSTSSYSAYLSHKSPFLS